MAKYRAHIAFIVIMATYFLIRYLRSTVEHLHDFIRFHLTDLLFVPAMCLFALIILRFTRRTPELTIPWYSVMIQVAVVCFYFEWYLPNNTPKGHTHVADIVDCFMYFIGGILFNLLKLKLTDTAPHQ